ncbi:hypothetical protein WA588_006082, partial [Blastocystis sp. NMH]
TASSPSIDIERAVDELSERLFQKPKGTVFLSVVCGIFLLSTGVQSIFKTLPFISMSIIMKLLSFICILWFGYCSFFFFWKSVTVSPHYESCHLESQPLASKDTRFCPKCNCYVNEGSFHCDMCRECVMMYDHHCVWLNNCIGFGNLRYFILFLFFTSVYMIICGVTAVRFVIEARRAAAPIPDAIVFQLLLGVFIGSLFLLISIIEFSNSYKKTNTEISQVLSKLGWKWLLPIPFDPQWKQL